MTTFKTLEDAIKTVCKEIGTNRTKVRIKMQDTIKGLGYCWHDACTINVFAFNEITHEMNRIASGSCISPNDPMVFHQGQDLTIPDNCVIIEAMTYPKRVTVYQKPVAEKVFLTDEVIV